MEKNPTGHHTVTRDPPQAETLATILTQVYLLAQEAVLLLTVSFRWVT